VESTKHMVLGMVVLVAVPEQSSPVYDTEVT
jgi:hypothetical protein